jgi:hypothetical protein
MLLEESLYSFLTSDSAVSAMVEDRVFAEIAPQKSPLPRIVYTRIATQRTQSLCKTDSKVRALMQIDLYDRTYKGSKDLAKLIFNTLIDFTGNMAGTRVSSVISDSEVDLDDPDPGLYRVSQTYFIWFVES